MKVKVLYLCLLAILLSACQNSFAFQLLNGERKHVYSKTHDTVFNQKLRNALIYLENVSGNDGIKRVVILKGDEFAFKGNESDVMQNVWSCTKSFTSTVLGLLIAEGKCSLDDKVYHYIPELRNHYPEVTFRNFITMTSGYAAKNDAALTGHGQSKNPFQPSPTPLFTPGLEFRYWDSAMNMLAYALTKVADEPIKDYFKEKVADHIGMDSTKWDWQNFGEVEGKLVNGGAGNKNKGIFISATEMARFGQLYLNKGNWNGNQIIPTEWVEQATSPQVENIVVNNGSTPYGYNWWTSGIFPDAPKDTFAAMGFNNNLCIVIPQWNIVIARLGMDGNIENEKLSTFIKLIGEAF